MSTSAARAAVPKRVFVSYASNDGSDRATLARHLGGAERRGLIELWHDHKIEPGQQWESLIAQKLDEADVVLLLISGHFLASEFIYSKELSRAMERSRQSAVRVIPVIVNSCNWKSEPFAALEVLPKKGMPIRNYVNPDDGWTEVSEHIERLAGGGA